MTAAPFLLVRKGDFCVWRTFFYNILVSYGKMIVIVFSLITNDRNRCRMYMFEQMYTLFFYAVFEYIYFR